MHLLQLIYTSSTSEVWKCTKIFSKLRQETFKTMVNFTEPSCDVVVVQTMVMLLYTWITVLTCFTHMLKFVERRMLCFKQIEE